MFQAEKIKDACVAWIREFFEKNGPGCTAVVGINVGCCLHSGSTLPETEYHQLAARKGQCGDKAGGGCAGSQVAKCADVDFLNAAGRCVAAAVKSRQG